MTQVYASEHDRNHATRPRLALCGRSARIQLGEDVFDPNDPASCEVCASFALPET